MRGDLFTHEVQKTSSVFGRKQDVSVVFQGDGAATDGSTIYLPSIDHNAEVDDATAEVIRGYVDHESGHVKHTNFKALRSFFDECARENNTLLKSLANGLEDVWLEKRVMRDYPGSEKNLRATTSAVNREFLSNVKKSDKRLKDDRFLAPVAITWEGRKDYGGDTIGECLDVCSDNLRKKLPIWVKAVDSCRNSKDIVDLARTIERELREEADANEETDNPNGGTKGGDDSSSGDGSRTKTEAESDGSTDEGADRDGSQSDDTASDGEKDDGDKPKHKHGNEFGGGERGDAPDTEAKAEELEDVEVYEQFDVKDCVVKELRKTTTLLRGGSGSYRPLSTASDKWHHRLDDPSKYGSSQTLGRWLAKGTADEYDKQVAGMAGDVNVMRRKLERALLSRENRDWDYAKEQGRLDSRRFVGAYNSKPNVFKIRTERQDLDTAVTFLIDLSGSMASQRAYVAMQCTIAMIEAIDRTSIKYEVLGFNNRTRHKGGSRHSIKVESTGRFSRYEPLDMYIFKAYEERLYEAKGAISAIADMAGGNNSDGEAILYARDRLKPRSERRKIMFVLSDGMPCASGDSHALDQHCRDAVNQLIAEDIECLGIGIQTEDVKRYYPKYTVVDSVETLAHAGMDNLARILLGERFVVDNSLLLNATR